MMKQALLLVLICQLLPLSAQDNNKEITFAYYFLDNFFDVTDDIIDADDEYNPSGSRMWNESRFRQKIEGVVEVIREGFEGESPDIIALSGIENINIAREISGHRSLRRSNYKILFSKKSPGIALLSKQGVLSGGEVEDISNSLIPSDSSGAVIMYIKCILNDNNEYHIFINDWPGREGGIGSGDNLKMSLAASVRKEIDKILNFKRDARILVLGTFNDEPTDRSIMIMLNAANKKRNLDYRDLYNLYYDMHNENGEGTFITNNIRQMFDYFMVSPSLLKGGDGYYLDSDDAFIVSLESPFFGPTYRGDTYLGGLSNHLPVYIKLRTSSTSDGF